MTRRVSVTVKSVKGYCAAGHKPGDRAIVGGTEGLVVDGYICPTALYSMYPMIYALKHGATIGGKTSLDVACPDAENLAIFEITADGK